jgi:hypothetical protein
MMRKIVVDTNLLLLWVAGTADLKLIEKNRRLYPKYKVEHFNFLMNLLSEFQTFIVTPHSLAELWNLIGEQKDAQDSDFQRIFYTASAFVSNNLEVYTPATTLLKNPNTVWLGLSDVAQIDAAVQNSASLVSSDGRLCHQARQQAVEAYSFWTLFDPTR